MTPITEAKDKLRFKNDFIAFLMQNNALGKFIIGLRERYDKASLREYILKHSAHKEDAILCAFQWSQTEQGRDFWQKLHTKYTIMNKA